MLPPEIRPQHVGEHELAVGQLPQQEVGDAEFPRGADHQIGVGQIRGIEVTADGPFVDLGRAHTGRHHGLHGVDDLGPAAVVERHSQGHGPVVRREGAGLVHPLDDPTWYPPVPPTDETDADAHLVQLVSPAGEELSGDDAEKEADFLVGPAPVLRGEGVHRKERDAELEGPTGRVEECLLPRPVTLGTGQALLGRPPAVAIHHARHMAGYAIGVQAVQFHRWQATCRGRAARPGR